MEKNLIKKYKRGKLEGYLGSIGCDEDEKSIITDLVKENNSINKKKTLQYKKIRQTINLSFFVFFDKILIVLR